MVFRNSGESLQKMNGRAPKVYAAFVMLLISQAKGWRKENMFTQINNFITWFDGVVWGLPLIILILITGFLLTVRLGFLQVRHLGKALKFMVKNEEGGEGEVTSFGALCTALSATIGTGNIVGVATAIAAGGPGALFWMIAAAFFGAGVGLFRIGTFTQVIPTSFSISMVLSFTWIIGKWNLREYESLSA